MTTQQDKELSSDLRQLAYWLLTSPESGYSLHFAGPLESLGSFSRVRLQDGDGKDWTLTARLAEGYKTQEQLAETFWKTVAQENEVATSPQLPAAPNCGACPGDGSICKSACKHDEENPPHSPVAQMSGDEPRWTQEMIDKVYADAAMLAKKIVPGRLADGASHPFNAAVAAEFDVRNMLKDVVPGDDGMGQEVYFKNVDEVVQVLTDMSEKLEAATVPPAMQEIEIGGDGFFAGLKIIVDPNLPPDTIALRSGEKWMQVNLKTGLAALQPIAASPSIVPNMQPIETAPMCKDVLVRTEIGTYHVAANHHGKWEDWYLHEIKAIEWMPIPEATPITPSDEQVVDAIHKVVALANKNDEHDYTHDAINVIRALLTTASNAGEAAQGEE